MSEPSRIVVIDPAFLGDVVFDGPLVRALKSERPSCSVGIVVRPPAKELAERIDGIDRVHIFDKRGGDRGLRGLLRVAEELREARYDVALIPHPSPRSAILAAAARIPVRVGSTPGRVARMLLTDHRPEEQGDTFVTARLRLARRAAGEGELEHRAEDALNSRVGTETSEAASRLAGTLVARSGREGSRAGARSEREGSGAGGRFRLGLHLGSEWATKRWSIAQAADLARALDPATIELVLLGSILERPLFADLRRLAGGEADAIFVEAQDAVGGTVGELVEAIAGVDLLIAGDTGPLHMARALGVPVIALFGPTPELRHGFEPHDRVLAIEIACRPCSAHGGQTCPEGHHRCMKELEARRVLGAVEEAIARRASSPPGTKG